MAQPETEKNVLQLCETICPYKKKHCATMLPYKAKRQ